METLNQITVSDQKRIAKLINDINSNRVGTNINNINGDTITIKSNSRPPRHKATTVERPSSADYLATSARRAKSGHSQLILDSNRAKPVLHEPCSSTLAKYHDSINQSIIISTSPKKTLERTKSSTSFKPTQPFGSSNNTNRRVLEAKEKYKYMTNPRTFIDESLFGSPQLQSSRSHSNIYMNNDNYYLNHQAKDHLSHLLMSNYSPLIHNPPPQSSSTKSTTERSDSARSTNRNKATINKSEQVEMSSRPPISRPWKP
jgi:hypothetical protein